VTLFHHMAEATAARHGQRPALRHRGRELRHAELVVRARRVAAGLAARGVRRGDRVAVYLQNRPEVVEIALACSRLGAIVVPVNPLLKARQLRYILGDSGAMLAVVPAAALPNVIDTLRSARDLTGWVVCDADAAAAPVARQSSYESLAAETAEPPETTVIDRDPLAILYTSGSTGAPKGVVVSHRNVVSGAEAVSSYLANEPGDRLLAALPLSFDYGFSQVSTALFTGACAVLTSYSTAAALAQEIAAEAITGLAGVPTMWAHLAESDWSAPAVRSLRYITNSGGALTPALLRKLRNRLPRSKIYCMYGLTEAFRSTYLDPRLLDERPGSIGKAVPNQEVLVLRPDGSPCDLGEPGELVHRGSFVALGYWNNAERTHRRFRPLPASNVGLLGEIAVWSGDIVRKDAEGFLYFIGRNDQLIKTSGNRVSATEIEEVIAEVAGVVEVAAVGVPDEVLGQRIVVAVVTQPARAADIVNCVRQHARMNLPTFMVPAHIAVLDSIPRNANGKPDRDALAERLATQGVATPAAAPPVSLER
jgi:acyl-CoA ligase (AMP-forming) (exosortase A-associated)